ncbi:uncharacterized protein LOC127838312 isoform X2 [Dreissena polymorpha]|uniref:uncharacterized protein LOC127838312 isoform X2 n=1 Tax=Dreissena polymorpha TaxID=45954 RepID=UPI0022650A26|nr:uncharacterized protein LOC127838312 isoform X2 [Dreissena polymorpha]
MAYLGYSEDFDLDDDGILRDSTESEPHWMDVIIDKKTGGILIDDDGIVRDDFDLHSKHGSSTHWTDSGLGGDKRGSTPSTLRQLDLQSYTSFDDVSRNLDESHLNISDFEASKDDISFDNEFEDKRGNSKTLTKGNRSGLSSRSSFDHSLNYDDVFDERDDKSESKQDLFGEEYYKQLQELGVLVDEDDFPQPRDSLQEFETIESNYSRDYDDVEGHVGDDIEQFLRTETVTPVRGSMDIEGPGDDRRRQAQPVFESHGFESFERDYEVNEGKRTRPNTASSTRTISSRSFPEISPEEALELYTERLHSLDNDQDSIAFEQTQSQSENRDNEDEIYFAASQEHDPEDDDNSPKPAKLPAYDIENKPSMTPKHKHRSRSAQSSDESRSGTPQGHSQSYDVSDRSRSITPQPQEQIMENNGYQSSDDRFDSFTQVSRLDSRNKTQNESDMFRPESALSQLSSVASEGRTVRPKVKPGHGKPPTQQSSSLSHAKSQESFFDLEAGGTKKVEKGPKRLLPKPSPGEEINQTKIMKSKSASNLNTLGPVKPTHMSLSEIRNINIDDPEIDLLEHDKSDPKSAASDVPKGELTKKLKQESSKRQQATQLVKQLQSDYDKLLSKYALAELTIDQMRLGAKISLHAQSPTPSQATSGSLQSAQHLHMLQLTGPQRGSVVSASPQQATHNHFFPEPPGAVDGGEGRTQLARGTSPAQLPRSDSTNSIDSTSTPRGEVEQPGGLANDAEKVKLGLMFQARNLDERMQSFQSLLGDNQLSVEEQETVFDKIRTDHEKLRRDYLQSKEDYTVLRRSTPAGLDVAFDQEKELEGQLFQIGMKFDEIHEKVDENLKEKSAKRQPFQQKRRESADLNTSMDADPSTENLKKKIAGVSAGNHMLEPRRDPVLDDKLKRLHDDYNALMDRYRRLKQMAKTPEREQEIDNLVKKLHIICDEEPDIFRLPNELLSGYQSPSASQELKQEKKHHIKNLPPTPAAEKSSLENKLSADKRKLPDPKFDKGADKPPQKSPAKSYEILTASETWSLAESIERWEKTKDGLPGEVKQRSRSHEQLNTSITSSRSFHSEKDFDGRDKGEGRVPQRSGSYSSVSSRGRHTPDSHGPHSPSPSLPRPRRHDYPDRERRERNDLRKKPVEGGSTTSLQDSGISEHEGGATGFSGPNSPLSKLPGPGKFKQMTGRREADTDSGFIGSMVGSEVSAGNLSSRRQPPQSPLRLRQPGDTPSNQRPSSRQSSRSDDSARVTTPRSVASSKSSRRTPTKAFPLDTRPGETRGKDAQANTATQDDSQPARQTDSRTKTRDQKGSPQRRRENTDDSYTSVTESEMSFDMEGRRTSRPSSRNTSLRNIEKIAEDSEEEGYSLDPTLNETTDINMSWITSDSDRPNVKQSRKLEVKQTPKKSQDAAPRQGSKVIQQQARGQVNNKGHDPRRLRETTDDDTSLTVSPTRDTTRDVTQDTTADTYTSDETTPRSVIERERRQVKQRDQAPPAEDGPLKPGPSPATQAPPPERTITPVKAKKSEMHPKKLHNSSLEVPPAVCAGLVQQPVMTQPKYVDRSIGSGSEETILASDAETAATSATRDSVNSARLKMLSSEIDKLREEFIRANQERSSAPQQVPPPAPPSQAQGQYYDQYFDPTEDPLAFMRGPRRRANSFSGHGGRDWDYDWTLPNVNRDGDIPLGYAAADAFASPRQRHKHKRDEANQEQQAARGRHRLRRKIGLRNAGIQPQGEPPVEQSPALGPQEEAPHGAAGVQGQYGYYTQQTDGTDRHPQGRRVFGSQPNLAFSGYQPPPAPRSTGSGSTKSSTAPAAAARPLRQSLYSYAANPTQNRAPQYQDGFYPSRIPFSQRQYANDDIRVSDGQTRFIPHGASEAQNDYGSHGNGGVYTSTCPLCGSSSAHSHGDYLYPPPDTRVPIGYLVNDGSDMYFSPSHHEGVGTRSRARSFGSSGRIRHYSPDGRVRSRYFVREFGDVSSDSAGSEAEEDIPRTRSRSVGRRRRPHQGRKYRRVRGEDEYESDRGFSSGSLSLKMKPASRTKSQRNLHLVVKGENKATSAAGEDDLNRSLRLVNEIDQLTSKMMDTVNGELSRSRRIKDFGSSVW